MSDARIVELAKAVQTAIEAGTYTEAYTAHRRYAPQWETKDLAEAKVTIVGHDAATSESVSRSRVHTENQVWVAIQRIAAPDDAEAVDTLALFAQQIADAVRRAAYEAWTWKGTVTQYEPDHLRQQGVFTALHTFTFQTIHA